MLYRELVFNARVNRGGIDFQEEQELENRWTFLALRAHQEPIKRSR